MENTMKKFTKHETAGMPMADQSWRARDDADTLRRAGEIMSDKSRLSAAKKEADKTVKALTRVIGGGSKAAPRTSSPGFAKGKR
jgi:hypothetical protein